jgi:hypothetical protein
MDFTVYASHSDSSRGAARRAPRAEPRPAACHNKLALDELDPCRSDRTTRLLSQGQRLRLIAGARRRDRNREQACRC